jgi:tRNA (cmo5U34)-methyltransferase
MTVVDFSFQDHAKDFDDHIRASIPGLDLLRSTCVRLSRRFVQTGTNVMDVGCSTGRLLATVREYNQSARPDVSYIGLDCVPDFKVHWDRLVNENVRFEVCDARSYQGFENVSVAFSIFMVQFIRTKDKLPLLQRVYDGLVEGGALLIAEKTLAETARLQDALVPPYYDSKVEIGFSQKEILDKASALYGSMTLWSEAELREKLGQAGFREMTPFWRSFQFVGLLALK